MIGGVTGRRRPWLLGVLVCAAAAGSTFALVFALTAGSPTPVAGTPAAAPAGLPNPLAGRASGKTFTHLPQRCALVSPATVARYLPGTVCNANAYQMTDGSQSRAIWTSQPTLTGGTYFTVDVEVLLSPLASPVTDAMKDEAVSLFGTGTVTDSRPVAHLGDEAYIVFGTNSGTARAYLVVADGNAQIDIDYSTFQGSRDQSEAAVLAMAHDVIGGLR